MTDCQTGGVILEGGYIKSRRKKGFGHRKRRGIGFGCLLALILMAAAISANKAEGGRLPKKSETPAEVEILAKMKTIRIMNIMEEMGMEEKAEIGEEKRKQLEEGGAGGNKQPTAEEILAGMSLESQIAQLFLVAPEQLTGGEVMTEAGDELREALKNYSVGGLIYFSGNLENARQLKTLTQDTQKIAGELGMLPLFLAIDEEGGEIARIGNHKNFDVPKVPPMAEIGAGGDIAKAREAGETIGAYLAEYGINLDFAPDADVLTESKNTVVKGRSFGTDPDLVTEMAAAYLEGLNAYGVCGAPKHFPGHGATKEDSHKGFAYINKSWEQLEEAELVPFRHFAEKQIPMMMSGHISLPQITGGDIPGSLSSQVLNGYLRENMGYEGIIITDALDMGAINKRYSAEEAAIMALEAGADMLLMPARFPEVYQAVLNAVNQGRISRERIEASVLRIIKVKEAYLSHRPEAPQGSIRPVS